MCPAFAPLTLTQIDHRAGGAGKVFPGMIHAEGPLLQVNGLSFRFPSLEGRAGTVVLDGFSWSVVPGGISVLFGAADAGKTTLGRILAGLIPRFTGGRLSGTARLGGRDLAVAMPCDLMEDIGLVSQDSDEQIFTTRCDSEVAFALESLGVPRQEMRDRVETSLVRMGLSGFAPRNPMTLSGGEKKRLLLACLDAIGPGLWVLDESLGELDQEWKPRVLDELERSGRTVVAFDSRWSRLLHDRGKSFALLERGRIDAAVSDPDDPALRSALSNAGILPGAPRRPVGGGEPGRSLIAEGIRFRFKDPGGFDLSIDSLDVARGEICALVGRNGSGKSTLGRILCGLLSPDEGCVSLSDASGKRKAAPGELCRTVGYLFQNPDHQIYLPSVREELSLGLRRRGAGKPEIDRMVEEAIDLFHLPDPEAPPALMSYGARRRLQAATYHLLGRDFLILDEVDSGLSYREVESLLDTLFSQRPGVILITHDLALARNVADRILQMDAGRAVSDTRRGDFDALPDPAAGASAQ
jgi:energy-coupling factor transport system ATP-binding protein